MRVMWADEFQASIEESFHLFNTLRVSSEHMARDVRKVVAAGADDKVIEALYEMAPYSSGQNLRRFSEISHDERESKMAALWLSLVISSYEVWADDLPVEDSGRACQFPTAGTVGDDVRGFGDIFAAAPVSPRIDAIFGAELASHARNLGVRVDDALAIYRFYKECRNSLVHSGGRANDRVELWGARARKSAGDLHVNASGGPMPIPQFVSGDRVSLRVDEVRCFASVLLRIAYTVAAQLSVTELGFQQLKARWQRVHGDDAVRVEKRKFERVKWLENTCHAAKVPWPGKAADLGVLLQNEKLVEVF